ncbi:uncharacterized protein [Lolium perenne]|uniref:uncharacterized protein n=1 Tax=Lolium perenne TaxID=4522 RepID=UPI0021F688C5|nr:vascular-related unknown protein 1-like [Lolium perenne]
MENTTSPHSSCVSPAATMSAGESSWAMHFADFLASSNNRQEMDHQGGGASESSFSSGFSSSFDSLGDDDDSFITSDLMDEDDEDDSLQDTACSSAAGPKVTNMHDMWMKSILTMDAKKMDTTQLAKYFLDAGSRQQATAGAAQEVISGGNNNDKHLYECSDLRKKGLCLVPLSMLIDYLG